MEVGAACLMSRLALKRFAAMAARGHLTLSKCDRHLSVQMYQTQMLAEPRDRRNCAMRVLESCKAGRRLVRGGADLRMMTGMYSIRTRRARLLGPVADNRHFHGLRPHQSPLRAVRRQYSNYLVEYV